MLRERIDDAAFLGLIRKWLKAERFYRELQGRFGKFNLEVAPGKTAMLRFNRFHPGMKVRISFYSWAEACAFKWLNRRGGKRKSFTLKAFTKAIDLLGIAKPKMRVVNRQHRVFT
ncbi:hypothetical protein [uncultured Desulfobacter sp.]|uniref:hypothetical protein n=1 Tax=uncultured Desulfobacter sp. TaxID=240139 RepID=UPI002AAC1D5F|nr:hypothetical protein [uncultured Desulfobacter sp.]